MSEENQESGMSAVKKAVIGAVTTAVTAGGAWFATHFGGEEPKEETKTEQAAPAAAPVINLQVDNSSKNMNSAGGGTTTIIKDMLGNTSEIDLKSFDGSYMITLSPAASAESNSVDVPVITVQDDDTETSPVRDAW